MSQKESFVDYDGLVEDIAIEDQDSEVEVPAEVDAEDYDGTKKKIFLSRGGAERKDKSKIAEIQGSEDGKYTRIIVDNEYSAVGMYLNVLEQYGFDEKETMEQFKENDDIFSGYVKWLDNLTIEDRKNRAMNQAQDRAHRSPHIKKYIENGNWRKIKKNDKINLFAEKLYNGINSDARRCYENSTKSIKAINNENLSYFEGFALPKQAGRIVAHSWVEFNDYVIELTWPWHAPTPPKETIYYGVSVSKEDIINSVYKRGFTPYYLTDEEIANEFG